MVRIGQNIEEAKKYLLAKNVVGIPTETVYGLAANALDNEAITKIFEVKNRPFFDPLIVHTYSIAEFEKYIFDFNPKAIKLAEKFMPGPLTLLLPKKNIIPDLITAGLPKVAIRIPNHELTLDLLKTLDFPLAAPSANPFGYVSPTSAKHVADQLGSKIPYILDGGQASIGLESTIVGFEGNKTIVYRKGGLAIEEIEDLIGKVVVKEHSDSNPTAPGMLKSHYSPNLNVLIWDENTQFLNSRNGAIVFDKYIDEIPVQNQLMLSKSSNLNEAAQNIFAYLREIETFDIDNLYVKLLPENGLGRAINDRLRRAAAV
jgi:L-threonylcarbamoyladenylate synthase